MLLHILDEALARSRIGIPAVHKAVHKAVFNAINPSYVNELQKMIERGVDTACGCQAHQMKTSTVFLCKSECGLDFGILLDGVVGAGVVDSHQILIDNPPGPDVEMPRL